MPTELDDLIDNCWWDYKAAWGNFASIAAGFNSAGGELYVHDYQRAGTSIQVQGVKIGNLREQIVTGYSSSEFWIIDALQWISDNWPSVEPPPEVSMQTIISAMFVATNTELKQFIGLIDAYRQSLWNQPFDRDYWAAIARGFELWG